MRNAQAIVTLLTLLVTSFDAAAHLLHGEILGVVDGFLHPIIGRDHLIAMSGIGFWLGCQEKTYSFRLLVLLLLSLIAGALLAVLPSSSFWLEPGLASSVILLGVLIAGWFPRSVGYGLSVASGVLHGYAHGLEIPASSGALAYGLGFLTATAVLQAVGWCLGTRVHHDPWVKRICGALMVTLGAQMLLS
jgi:urease accessory protein